MFERQELCGLKSTDCGVSRPKDESRRLFWGADESGDSAPS